MSSVLDYYLKGNILRKCEEHFNAHLKEEGFEHEKLLPKERELMEKQLGYLLDMIVEISSQYEDDFDGYAEIIDKLIGFCIISKMNECRLCRIINNLNDKINGDDDGNV